MNTLTHTNIHSVWPTMQAKSCRVPSVQTMVARRLNGQRAATKVMIRYIPYNQDELDAVVDALIDATRPAPQPEPTPVVVAQPSKRTRTMSQRLGADLLFLLSMLFAVVVGVWSIAQYIIADFAALCRNVAPAFDKCADVLLFVGKVIALRPVG